MLTDWQVDEKSTTAEEKVFKFEKLMQVFSASW